MASTGEIKSRINSVNNTRKITNAMYLISSTKLQKAKQQQSNNEPYFKMLKGEIREILAHSDAKKSRYRKDRIMRSDLEDALVVITADKGLAGSYNHNVLKRADEIVMKKEKCRIYCVGEYGKRHFEKKKGHGILDEEFHYTAQDPTFHRARAIAGGLLDLYDADEIDEITILYSRHNNYGDAFVVEEKILPLDEEELAVESVKEMEAEESAMPFFPSVDSVLETIIEHYLASYIYGALLESYVSEQNARMNAMSSANRNADLLLDDLNVRFNRMRQAGITQEITEVAAGARSQKKKKKKEKEGTPVE